MAKEPTLANIWAKLVEVESTVQMLVEAAREGGGLVPPIDYKRLRKLRKKVKKQGIKVKCKKECKKGPCRYGGAQALKCYESFEKIVETIKRRELFASHIPYTKQQLVKLRRRDILTVAGLVGVNMHKFLRKSKGKGSDPIIEEILRLQPRYIKKNKGSAKEQERKDVQTMLKIQPTIDQAAEGSSQSS